ncbi:acyltransferase family protein [Agrobacterium cavarae]|uniref:acyltransferase family protein n=1 Tax=Agrobacterium cavarae TaxID=2528239 RepID=UPI0035E42EEB
MQCSSLVKALKEYAIFGVVSIHVGPESDNLPKSIDKLADYGFRGDTLFLVVSAFTMSISLSGKPLDGRSYFIKRSLRLETMYILAIILYGIFGLIPTALPIDYILNAFLMHGISPPAQNTVVPGGWSVASEALFYILLPALLPICNTIVEAVIGLGLAYVIAVVSHFGLR